MLEPQQVSLEDSGEVQLHAVDASQAGASEANPGVAGPRWANLMGVQADGGEAAQDAFLEGATPADGPRAMEARAYAGLVRLRLLRWKLQTVRRIR
jgi:hypothetical protein